MSRGIDISHHTGTVDWGQVATDEVAFAMVRATEGAAEVDRRLTTNREGARAAGVAVGAYHVARPGATEGDAVAEATHHLAQASPEEGDLVPALVLEATQLDPEGTTRWALAWLDTVEQAIGATPFVCTSAGWASTHLEPDLALLEFPLWVVHLTTDDEPRLPEPWTEWTWWQHSHDGRVAGIDGDVDLDRTAIDELPLWSPGRTTGP